jgi:hypothetical protein
VKGNGGTALITLFANSTVLNNTANVSGGGIRLEGSARLRRDGRRRPGSLSITRTEDYGGGVEVLAPARADIGSGGYNGNAVVSDNTRGWRRASRSSRTTARPRCACTPPTRRTRSNVAKNTRQQPRRRRLPRP